MKNLLLLFLVSFALFWVGCEKEEFVEIQEDAVTHNSAKASKNSTRVRAATQSELEKVKGEQEECCTVKNYLRHQLIGDRCNGTLEVTFLVIPSDLDDSPTQNGQVQIRADFTNSIFAIPLEVCEQVSSTTTAFFVTVPYDPSVISCPYDVSYELTIFGIDDDNVLTQCDNSNGQRVLSDNIASELDPSYVEGNDCFVCGVVDNPQLGEPDCYDDFGNPIPC